MTKTSISTISNNECLNSRKLKMVAFMDATEEVVEPALSSRIDDFEKAKSDAGARLDITAQLYRKGASPLSKIAKGLGLMAIHAAIPAAGFIIAGPLGLALGIIDVSLFFLPTGTTRQAINELDSGFNHRRILKEPDWKGNRTFEITENKTEKFDSKIISEDVKARSISSGDLTKLVSDRMKNDPDSTKLLFISGHGLGYRQVAGMPVKELASALEKSEKESGAKPDIIFMESCLEGNMEGLCQLKNRAKIAILSEEFIYTEAMPIREMLREAALKGGTPKEISRKMIEKAGETGKLQTMAAFDLNKIDGFLSALDILGKCLLKEEAEGKKSEIKSALRKTVRLPKLKSMILERALLNFSDMGGFLSALMDKKLSAETKEAIKSVQNSLKEMIIAYVHNDEYRNMSGISFQSGKSILSDVLEHIDNMGKYDDVNIPESWKTFIKTL